MRDALKYQQTKPAVTRPDKFSPELKAKPDRKGQKNWACPVCPEDPAPLARHETQPPNRCCSQCCRDVLPAVLPEYLRVSAQLAHTSKRQKGLDKQQIPKCPWNPLHVGRAAERDGGSNSRRNVKAAVRVLVPVLSVRRASTSRRCTLPLHCQIPQALLCSPDERKMS